MKRIIAVVLPSIFLAGCFSQAPAPTVERTASAPRAVAQTPAGPGYYTVKRGDTLYRIAMEHGQDYRDVATWNNVTNPDTIKEGQVLRVMPPTASAAEGAVVARPVDTSNAVESRPLEKPAATASTPPVATTTSPAAGTGLKREPKGGKEPYSDEAYARLNKPAESMASAAKPAESKPAEAKPETKPEPAVAATPAASAGSDDVVWMWPYPGKVTASFNESSNKGLDFAGKAGDAVLAAADGKVVYAGSGLRGYGELIIVKHTATYLSAYGHNRKILVKEGQSVTRGQKIAEMGNSDADSVKLHFEIRKQGKPVDPAQYLPKR